MKNIDLVDIVYKWKAKPVWLRAFVWFMLGVLVGTFVKA